jgi:hypothetical protein
MAYRITLIFALVIGTLAGGVLVSPTPAFAADCEVCTAEARKAEYERMFQLFRAAVQSARASGFKCSSDPDYSDRGGGNHTAGNCADWQRAAWEALIQTQWNCWNVVKIRAAVRFTIAPRYYHHFVVLVPECGGERIYFDAWVHGVAVASTEKYFKYANGLFSWWTHYIQDSHRAGDPARQVR